MFISLMSILLFSILLFFWALGIGYLPNFFSKYEKNALAIIIGFTVFVLIITISGFLNFSFEEYNMHILLIYLTILAFSLYLLYKKSSSIKEIVFSKELTLQIVLILLLILVYLYPMLEYKKLATIYYYSGDFHSYWSHGFILQKYPIGSHNDISILNSLAQSYVDYKGQGLRIGASEVLAYISSITNTYPQSVFSIISGVVLAMQALMFSLLVYTLTKKNVIISLIGLFLYGIHPLFSWEMYAAFYPQGYGLLFLIAIIYIYQSGYWKDYPIRISIILSLFISALALTYVEILAISFVVILFSFLAKFKISELKSFSKVILFSTIFSLIITIVSLDYIIKGLIIQLQASAYGGGQIITLQTVLSLLFGFMRPPLDFNNINEFSMILPSFFSFTLIIILSIVVLFNVFKKEDNIKKTFITWIVLFATLFIYVALRYDSTQMTWNMFKVLNYFGPLLFAMIIVSIFSFKSKKIAFPIILVFMYTFFIGQNQFRTHLNKNVHFVESNTLIQTDDEFVEISKIIKKYKNELFYIGASSHKERFELYSLLAFNNFITIYDALPFNLKWNGNKNLLEKELKSKYIKLKSSFEKNGVSFLLLLKSDMNKYPYNKILFDNGKVVLLDVRKQNFILPVQTQFSEQKHSVIWVNNPKNKTHMLLANGRPGELKIKDDIVQIKEPFTFYELKGMEFSSSIDINHPGYLEIYNFKDKINLENKSEINIDLLKADIGGDKNTIKNITYDSVLFENKDFTSSYLVFQKDFEKGLYYFELNMGNIDIESDSKILENSDGRPVFFGVESNNFLTFKLINSDSNNIVYYPFYVDNPKTIRFYAGIGAWCLSRGNVEFKKIKLFKIENND